MWTRDWDLNSSTDQKWTDVPPFICGLNEDKGMKTWEQLRHREASYRAQSFQRLFFFCYSGNQLRALQILLIFMIPNISGRGIRTMSNLNGIMNTNPLRNSFFFSNRKNLLKLNHRTFKDFEQKYYRTFQNTKAKTF